MRLEDLALNLRSRTPWEATDLGAIMYRQWWPAIARAWLAVFGPVALVLFVVCYRQPWLAILLLWWLKPVFDRFVLHVLSRAVFGAVPGAGETLRAWRDILRDGTWADLTYRRFTLRRSFRLPITQLEGPSSKSVSERAAVLGQRIGGHAAAITLACMGFELVALIAVEGLVDFFTPDDPLSRPFSLFEWLRGSESQQLFAPLDVLYYAAAVSLIEPLYVAQGFGLYMVRRTLLEGWDIEIGFRRIANRLAQRTTAAVLAALLVVALGSAALDEAHAQPSAASLHKAREQIDEVMRAPEFERYRDVDTWRWKGSPADPLRRDPPAWLKGLASVLAETARAAAWILAIIAIGALVWFLRRFTGSDAEPDPDAAYSAPAVVAGMDVRPETLPEDVPDEARRLLARGAMRESLSLLYRGALSALIHRYGVELRGSFTENDCLRASEPVLDEQASDYFVRLVTDWRACAYADHSPGNREVEALIATWAQHMAGPPREGDPSARPLLREAAA